MSNASKALLNIIGGESAITNIKNLIIIFLILKAGSLQEMVIFVIPFG